jgi:8-oxo-dGTP pyrophosphatase MutT (NUDIX family)
MQEAVFSSTVDAHTQVKAGVMVLIRDSEGRILMEQRSDCGLWGLPGGKIEPGESVAEAAIREVQEETGLSVRVIRLLGFYSEPEGRIVLYPNAPHTFHLVDVFLEAAIVSGNLTLSAESRELRFVAPHELPQIEEIVPPLRAPLQDFVDGKSGLIK